ncbi:MAG: hypothetical protein ACD_72C00167G0001 [uncultured bacterium]|nr:MAG: hypothetical protein ACD_72C00167G0001 [uncultured bacterium]
MFKVPYSFIEDALNYNVLKVIKQITKPILFIAGEKDETAPLHLVQQIYDQANQPKKFVVIKNIGHDYRLNPEEIKLVNQQVIKFLSEQSLC